MLLNLVHERKRRSQLPAITLLANQHLAAVQLLILLLAMADTLAEQYMHSAMFLFWLPMVYSER